MVNYTVQVQHVANVCVIQGGYFLLQVIDIGLLTSGI